MQKGHLQQFINKSQNIFFFSLLIVSGLAILLWLGLEYYTDISFMIRVGITASIITLLCLSLSTVVNSIATKPLKYLGNAIYHVQPNNKLTTPPNLESIGLGRELTTSLVRQIYDLASTKAEPQQTNTSEPIIDLIRMPILGIDSQGIIKLANSHAVRLSGASESIINKKFSEVFNLDEADNKISEWLDHIASSQVTDNKSWSRVGLAGKNNEDYQYYDLSASYSQHSSAGTDTLLCFFDQIDKYTKEDDSFSFIALAVHELRTPLTILRGYAEVLEQEVADNNDQSEYVKKMRASVDSLSFFVSNILNVARFDKQKLELTLAETVWSSLLEKVVEETKVRAEVYGKKINLEIADDLPTVGADPTTITEVLVNLIDNAIKYSARNNSDIDIIAKLNEEGMVETTVKDQGEGIPESVMPHLFEKFSRNHRNKSRVAGTGLGLYICKAIISAHDGNISARSKDGKGSEFSFTLQPYSVVASQNTGDQSIIRTGHGWIKNHNLNRS